MYPFLTLPAILLLNTVTKKCLKSKEKTMKAFLTNTYDLPVPFTDFSRLKSYVQNRKENCLAGKRNVKFVYLFLGFTFLFNSNNGLVKIRKNYESVHWKYICFTCCIHRIFKIKKPCLKLEVKFFFW